MRKHRAAGHRVSRTVLGASALLLGSPVGRSQHAPVVASLHFTLHKSTLQKIVFCKDIQSQVKRSLCKGAGGLWAGVERVCVCVRWTPGSRWSLLVEHPDAGCDMGCELPCVAISDRLTPCSVAGNGSGDLAALPGWLSWCCQPVVFTLWSSGISR